MTGPALIYDITDSGHRARDAAVVAKVLGGTVLLESPSTAFRKLIGHRGCVIWQTADYVPAWFTAMALLRSLKARRTVAICYRNNAARDRKYLRHFAREVLFRFWNIIPFTRALTTCAPIARHDTASFLFDTEWWDMTVMPLPDVPVPDIRKGRKTVLLLGSISYLKGISFFIGAAMEAHARGSEWNFAMVGAATNLTALDRAKLQAAEVVLHPGPEDDAAFLSYMRQADMLWCCYDPIYDQSSGIFGRSLQLDKPTIVRKGSLLEPWQKEYGRGFAVTFDDVEEFLSIIDRPMPERKHPDCVAYIRASARRRLLSAVDGS